MSVARRPLHMVASTGLERKQHKTFPSLALIRNVCLVLFAHNLWVFCETNPDAVLTCTRSGFAAVDHESKSAQNLNE